MMGYQTNPNFSMFFASENEDQSHYTNYDPYENLSSSTSVDCTLSLGTPSTRLSEDHHRRFSSANSTNFYHGGNNTKTTSYKKSNNGDHNNLPRRCASCDTTSTPLWRNGPKGPKSLCNACGIRFKKEERRASARNSTVSGGASSAAEIPAENQYNGGGNYYSHHHHYGHQNAQRVPYFSPAPEMEYPYVHDDVTASSYLSWN